MKTKRIILAGGSGFLGRLLGHYFLERGWDVVVLTRSPKPQLEQAERQVREVAWDGQGEGEWNHELEGADALVNLAGHTVNCRYNKRNRDAIMHSRTDSTRALGRAIATCSIPPKVWLNASTATIYRHTFGPAWDESGDIGATLEAKDGFSIDVATAWEEAFFEARLATTRRIALRSSMVFGLDPARNNVLHMLRRLTRLGLGGRMGHGRQFVSWIHQTDFCRAIEFLIHRDDITGVVNVAAPTPVTNDEMMRLFRGLCSRPFGLPAPSWALEMGAFLLRTETELIIKSRRVIPAKLLEAGFDFQFPEMRVALEDLLRGSKTAGE